MSRLDGKRIAVAGSRRFEELSKLIENLGGIAMSRPAQGTIYLDDAELKENLKSLMEGTGADWFILTTGSGVETLMIATREMGREEDFVELLRKTRIAARGYKTVNVLKKLGVEPTVQDDDGTTDGLIRALSAADFAGGKAAVQLHGEPMPKLARWLEIQRAEYLELMPYRHTPPDSVVMDNLITEITRGQLDAVAFTTALQVRYLMDRAKRTEMLDQVADAFNHRVVAAAVGKVTAEALKEEGIRRIVVPQEERMGSMIVELAKYFF